MTPSVPPLYLYLAFEPERPASPVEAADVLQSLDDMYRVANQYWDLEGSRKGLGRVLRSEPDPSQDVEGFIDHAFRGGGPDSPLVADQVRFGSPLEIVSQIPWQVYAAGGAPAFWLFLERLERLWNLPQRIRVESARLRAEKERYDREYWEEKLRNVDAETMYWLRRRGGSGRFSQGGPAEPGAFLGSDGAVSDERPVLQPYDREDDASE